MEKTKNYYSIDEAAEKMHLGKNELLEAIKKKKIEAEEYTSTIISEDSLEAYRELMCLSDNPVGALDVDWDTVMKPFNLRWFFNRNPEKALTYYLYFVSDAGRVYNATLRKECQQSTSTNNYKQVDLRYGDKRVTTDVHKLVALMFCPNRRCCENVHHIDNVKHNNRAENLIWLSKDEHWEAHRLMKEAQKSGQWDEYNRYIEGKRAENEWRERWHLTTMPTPSEPDIPTTWEINHRWWHELKQNPEKMREMLGIGPEYVWDDKTEDFVLDPEVFFNNIKARKEAAEGKEVEA